MAKAKIYQMNLFIDNNINCKKEELIEWIIELLSQQDFDNYILQIEEDNKECEE